MITLAFKRTIGCRPILNSWTESIPMHWPHAMIGWRSGSTPTTRSRSRGILDQHSPKTYFGRYRYFIGKDYRVGGATINLYDLERQVLIKQFQEPLIHFAIVCASTSCPKLQPWTYEPVQLDVQLDRVAREFINDPMRNRFDRTHKVASLSMIFKWFDEEFINAAGSVLAYIARYVSDPELAQDLMQSEYRIEYLKYDWTLNGITPKESAHAGSS